MESLMTYIIKSLVCSGFLYTYYFIFLKDKTFHRYNRFYLMFTLFVSILLPLLKVEYFTIEVNPKVFMLMSEFKSYASKYERESYAVLFHFLGIIVALVSVMFLFRLLLGMWRLSKLKNKYEKINFQGINFYKTDLEEAPFSYFKNLFWKNSIAIDTDLGRQILKHEMVHIAQGHSWDKFIVSLFQSIFWFNPIFYLIKKELSLIHEYLADSQSIKKGDTQSFAKMILEHHFSGKVFPATNPFLSSNLKKRIIMLKKSKTKFAYIRKVLALPLVFSVVFIYAVNTKNKEIVALNKVIEHKVNDLENHNNPKVEVSKLVSQKSESRSNDKVISQEFVYEVKNKSVGVKIDTLRKPNEDFIKAIQKERKRIEKYRKALESQRKKEEKIRTKIAELRSAISTKSNSEEQFKELEHLYSQLDGIYDAPRYKRILEGIEKSSSKIREYYQSSSKDAKQRESLSKLREEEAKNVERLANESRKAAEEASKISKDVAKKAEEARRVALEVVKAINEN
ncbi:peptidase M56 [Riemerella anatipestifer]|uniref:M56 family metallopeptidase n=1 Tax=Riemerella anatipestifer TaxID=34085 RepID=UPI000D140BEA|nr:M56 family metallopeptidase [Riemerella anatipestifer]MDD1523867.1 peptidase M56 [Riemerella anatipestifer]PST45109.1 peptidase M56 [Riemerella anatipestifer]